MEPCLRHVLHASPLIHVPSQVAGDIRGHVNVLTRAFTNALSQLAIGERERARRRVTASAGPSTGPSSTGATAAGKTLANSELNTESPTVFHNCVLMADGGWEANPLTKEACIQKLMARACNDPRACTSMLGKLGDKEHQVGGAHSTHIIGWKTCVASPPPADQMHRGGGAILSTHPPIDDRIARVAKQVPEVTEVRVGQS